MRNLIRAAALASLLIAPAFAKDPEKGALSPALLNAATVAVVIDPEAGVSASDPQANQVAQRDVEVALANWGRFKPVLSRQMADILIVIRRGHDTLVDDTIRDPRQNSRPGSVTTTPDGITLGGQHGQRDPSQTTNASSGTQMEIGAINDSFLVFENKKEQEPFDAPPLWRYEAKNALKPHGVPAVDQFRKAVAVADKIAAKHP